jgi:hypothetical protein
MVQIADNVAPWPISIKRSLTVLKMYCRKRSAPNAVIPHAARMLKRLRAVARATTSAHPVVLKV